VRWCWALLPASCVRRKPIIAFNHAVVPFTPGAFDRYRRPLMAEDAAPLGQPIVSRQRWRRRGSIGAGRSRLAPDGYTSTSANGNSMSAAYLQTRLRYGKGF